MKNNATTTQAHQATGKKRGAATFDDTLSIAPWFKPRPMVWRQLRSRRHWRSAQAADLPGNTTRVGDEFTVNTTKAGGQYFSTVTTFADGGYVVSWTDTSYTEKGADASSSQIRAQIFDANNNKVGKEFQVNTTVAGGQYRSQIAILASGDFVIAWEDQGETGGDTSGEATRAQMYHRDGTKIGGEFIVNTSTAGDQGEPAITALSNGGFVVTWNDHSGTRRRYQRLGQGAVVRCRRPTGSAASSWSIR